jgi:glycosyltransferase involved in cell wall biosynthesis
MGARAETVIAGHKYAVLLSFEGPDRYSSVGGLGTRVSALAKALGEAEVETEVFFVGDPALPAVETFAANVTLRRWCQWISAYHRRNVYDGEEGKVNDYRNSVPPVVAGEIVAKAKAEDERVLIIAEEWQTAEATIALDALLRARGLRQSATILWNANNTYGFDRIDWLALQRAAAIATVSKYMKFELARWHVPALVIPNGIDESLLDGPPKATIERLRSALQGKPALVKVGRFDPDKNWLQAIDAIVELRDAGMRPQLIVRGGREPYGEAVFERARIRGLRVERIEVDGDDLAAVCAALSSCTADVIHLRAFLPESTLYALYVACDAVLANSGKEPFGLVGLEVMASGGLAVCGSTGEDYAEPFVNAIVCDGDDGRELAAYLEAIARDGRRAEQIRQAGYATATRYLWPNVLETLAFKLEYVRERTL